MFKHLGEEDIGRHGEDAFKRRQISRVGNKYLKVTTRQQLIHDTLRKGIRTVLGREESDLGILRHLVDLINAGKIFYLAGHCPLVETLWVSRYALVQWRINENLYELFTRQFANHAAFRTERGDERAQGYQSCFGHQFRHLAHAADIFDTCGIRESKISIQSATHIVTVQQNGMCSERQQSGFHKIGDR